MLSFIKNTNSAKQIKLTKTGEFICRLILLNECIKDEEQLFRIYNRKTAGTAACCFFTVFCLHSDGGALFPKRLLSFLLAVFPFYPEFRTQSLSFPVSLANIIFHACFIKIFAIAIYYNGQRHILYLQPVQGLRPQILIGNDFGFYHALA